MILSAAREIRPPEGVAVNAAMVPVAPRVMALPGPVTLNSKVLAL